MKKKPAKPVFEFDRQPFEIRLTPTDRGFLCGEFKDRDEHACSIQESSIATEYCLWLGCDEGTHHHVTGDCMARMHLTPEMAQALVPLLVRFAVRGTLEPLQPEEQVANVRSSLNAFTAEADAHALRARLAVLESLLRDIRQTGFIRNTAHKIRARIDAVLSEGK